MRSSFWCRKESAAVLLAVLLLPSLAWGTLTARLEARHFSSSSWHTGTIHDWKEREGVPCRIRFSGGPMTNYSIVIHFDHSEGHLPLIEDINSFGRDDVVIKSGPTLSAPPGQDVWSYALTVDVTDGDAELRFEARLAAGAHLADRSAFRVRVEGIGELEIERPARATGTPDLVVAKSGPATASPGDILTYTLECYNKSEAINAADGVQVFDRLPPEVTFVPDSANWPAVLVGDTLRFDLGDLQEGERETVRYRVRVNEAFSFSQEFSNFAQIYSSEDDGDFGDNTSAVTTRLVKEPLVAVNDAYQVRENGVLDVVAPGVMGNDSGPKGATLLAAQVTSPQHGWVVFNADGSFIYMPNSGFSGTDAFTYSISDGVASSAPATVTIEVGLVNDPPSAAGDAYVTDEDTTLSISAPGVLANDSDPENAVLSAMLVATAQHGALQLNPDGSFSYRPRLNFYGVDTFTYGAADPEMSSGVATVTITVRPVNDAPTALDDEYLTDDRQALVVAAPGVLGNDLDPDGNALGAVLESGPSHGTLSLEPNGAFVYTPPLNFSGVDAFTYRASDGALDSTVATVRIAVNATAEPPRANDDQYAIDEDRILAASAPGVLSNDSDPDGDKLAALLVSPPAHGVLTLSDNGAFTYVPRPHFHGQDSFTYRSSDGVFQSGLATVSITVRSVNDIPVANLDSYQTYKGRALSVAGPGVLVNDLDADGDAIHAVLVQRPGRGNVTLNADGSFTYTPLAHYTGPDSFIYKASDGTAESVPTLVTLAIRPISNNIPPIVEIVRPTNATVFLAPADVTVVVEANDLDGIISHLEIFAGETRLGQFTAAPYYVVHTNLPPGQYAFHARATDDDGASSVSRTVHVTVVDRLPLIETTPIHFNPQTGLFEVAARVTNPTLYPFEAVRVLIYNLPPGARVYNVSGYTNSIPYVHSNLPLPPGGSIDFIVECYTPSRVAPPCTLIPVPVHPLEPLNPQGVAVPVRRVKRLADGTLLLDFNGALNRVHYVQYTDDMRTWKTALPHVIGTGTTMQWLDNGPPKTESHPREHPSRFYRVIKLP